MDKSYIWFDIECANCFDGVGKMCSFGYVITDGDFTILDEDDVVMNPETEFDWFLFDPKKGCQLAYSKDYFRAQHNFEAYYSGIKKIMEASGRKVIGFSVSNDIGFLQSACERYNFPSINYSAFDLYSILNLQYNETHKLEEWCQKLNVDISSLTPHKSSDDAKMTMLLTKQLCHDKGIELEQLLEENKGSKISVERYLEQREISLHNKEIMAKISELYGKKARAVLSHKLNGNYAIGFKLKNDIDESYKIANLVFKHGGVLMRSLKSNGTIIIEDDTAKEIIDSMHKKNLKTITISDFLNLVRME